MSTRITLKTWECAGEVAFGTSGLRGLVDHMSDELCYAYAAAFLEAVVGKRNTDNRVVLGHDLRPSSPRIAAACAKAIMDSGREVVYAGELPTPALASFAYENKLPAIIVTGSHIPFDRNGIKFYKSSGEISKADELLILQSTIDLPEAGITIPHDLLTIDPTVRAHYIKRYVDFFQSAQIRGLRIAIYEHSSVARDILHEIFIALGAEVISLGRSEGFVPIDTEAVRAEDVAQATQWAKDHSFDAIVSTDGDADRPLIGDENGQWLRGDIVGILCARFLSADVVVTPVSSNTLTEKSGWFKKVLRTKIGSPYVIEAMEACQTAQQIIVGFEANGGCLLGSDVMHDNCILKALPTRDAILPILALLSISRQNRLPVSSLIATLPPRYTASNRLQNFSASLSAQLISALDHDHQAVIKLMSANSGEIASIDRTDGFRVLFDNGDIVHLRPSGNAPELRCYAESEKQEKAELLCHNCLSNLTRLYFQ